MDPSTRDEALAGSLGVAGVRTLLYGRRTRQELRGGLRSLLGPGVELGRCRLERAKFKPGRKLTGYYVAEVLGSDGPVARPVVVTWTVPPEPGSRRLTPDEVAMEDEARVAGVLAPFCSLGAEPAGLGGGIRVSPLDVEFPQLVRLSTPARVHDLLAEVYQGASVVPDYTVTSVRYRPRQRHLLRYDPSGEAGEGSVFAKLYRPGEVARDARVVASVGERLEAAGPTVAAARPLPGSGSEDVLLYPRVPGAPLSSRLWRSSARRHLAGAGGLLRLLHSDGHGLDGDLPQHDLDAELGSIARAAEHLDPLLPTAAQRVARILDRARDLDEVLPAERPGFAHGDFKTDHVWAAGDRLTLLDFDTCCLAEPALDLGKLLADLSFWYSLAGRPGLATAQEQFLAGYGDVATDRLARTRLYEAIVLTKLTLRRLRRFDQFWELRTEALTARAEMLLDAAGEDRGRRAGAAPAAGGRA